MKDKYSCNTDGLNGEELLTLDEILSDIICWRSRDDDFMDSWGRSVEEWHEKRYNDYLRTHKDYQRPTEWSYEKDLAWMFAQTSVINRSCGKIEDDDIDEYFACGNELSEEQQTVWDKAIVKHEPQREVEYSCTDHFDFNWGR